MHIVLCGLQSPINIGMILRAAETFGNPVVLIDSFAVLSDPAKRSTISDFACGALDRQSPEIWDDYKGLDRLGKRVISTAFDGAATPMTGFRWEYEDVLLVGNEYSGVPDLLAKRANASVRIAMPSGYFPKPPSNSPIDAKRVQQVADAGAPALNVAIAASVLMVDAFNRAPALVD